MGSGKSTAASILSEFMPVNDCDAINAWLLEPSHPGYAALQQAGLLKTDAQGALDRQAMADAMFEHPQTRRAVEAILHPLILEQMRIWMKQTPHPCAVEVPLLFELGLEQEFDEIWTVTCSSETALKRLEQGRGICAKEARRRLALQYPPYLKAQQSDAVLENDGTLEQLRRQIEQTLGKEREWTQTRHSASSLQKI